MELAKLVARHCKCRLIVGQNDEFIYVTETKIEADFMQENTVSHVAT
jgi:hypothetical protein